MARRIGPPGPHWHRPPIGPRSLAARLTLAAFALVALALAFGGVLVDHPSESSAAHPGKPGRIAFDSRRDGSSDIYTMNDDGTGLARLTAKDPADNDVEGADDESPSWSPDGKSIVFHSNRAFLEGGTFRSGRSTGNFDDDIWVMDADGSHMRNLTPDSSADDTNPHFSFDGTKIVYQVESAPDFDPDIAVMNSDGTGRKLLTIDSPPQPPADRNPTFSQNGRIFFQSDRVGGVTQIFSMNADGSGQTPLTTGPAANRDPDVSPDARQVVFVSTRDDPMLQEGNLYLMNADGTGQQRLLARGGNEFRPSFSPGGLRVTFSYGIPPFGVTEIAVVRTDGTGLSGALAQAPDDDDNAPDWQPIPYRCFGQNPTIVGSYGDDLLQGTPGTDVIVGLSGNDTIKGANGNDILCGDFGEDRIFGGKGNDVLIGGPNSDELYGQAGSDRLYGGSPKTNQNKPNGKNLCVGGKGNDKVEIDCNIVKTP
jgi:Tol biopolymer transport system component